MKQLAHLTFKMREQRLKILKDNEESLKEEVNRDSDEEVEEIEDDEEEAKQDGDLT